MGMRKYLDFDNLGILFKTFFEPQFKYCPLMWVFHSRNTNNKINKLNERALRLVYDDYTSTFEELFIELFIKILFIKRYKVHNNFSQTIFGDLLLR